MILKFSVSICTFIFLILGSLYYIFRDISNVKGSFIIYTGTVDIRNVKGSFSIYTGTLILEV